MNPRHRPHLALLLAALVTIMCRRATGNTFEVPQAGGDTVSCVEYYDLTEFGGQTVNTCTFICPSGHVEQVDIWGDLPAEIDVLPYCDEADQDRPNPSTGGGERTATPTGTPTGPAPLDESHSSPLLTGQVTACNVKDGFINFKLVDADPGFNGSDVYLEINGTQVNCVVAGDERDILSCALPPGLTFPAQVHAAIGDASTDDFEYNGDDCVVPHEPKDPQSEPTPDDGTPGP